MKIALLHERLGRSRGGVEAWLYHAAQALAMLGHDVHAIAYRSKDLPSDAMPEGVKVTWLDLEQAGARVPGLKIRSILNFSSRCLEEASADADVFWSRSWFMTCAAARVARGRPLLYIQATPYPVFMRRTFLSGRWLDRLQGAARIAMIRWYEKRAMDQADALVYLSHTRRDETLDYYGRSYAAKCHVVPPGVDLERFRPPELPREWSGHLKTLTVCRLGPEKNVGSLVRAVALLKERDIFLESLIVGDGPLRGELQAMVNQLGVGDRVGLAGAQKQVEKFYQKADLFVLPSTYEGFGSAYIEAMACGLPCVALKRHHPEIMVASDEIIEPGVTGLLVEGVSPLLLAEALESVQSDPDRLRDWGRAARSACEKRFTWSRAVEDLLGLCSSPGSVPRHRSVD